MSYKWKPSRAQARAFAAEMAEISEYCIAHGISQSASGDSYYFEVNGQSYRVSNHSVESSNAAAFDELTGEKRREIYHEGGRKAGVVYIHASKTRIREIHQDLLAGYELDGRGNRR
jgi:ribosome biogenesis GTPase A